MDAAFRFAPDFKPRLASLARRLWRVAGAENDGARGGRAAGRTEFRDHRAYVAGDDTRFLDWNVFIRSGQLAVKTFARDEPPEVLVILDRSASMGPAGSRQDTLAREIAAALGWLALQSGGGARLVAPQAHGWAALAEASERRRAAGWIESVAGVPPPGAQAGPSATLAAATDLPVGGTARSAVAIVSDFMEEPLPVRLLQAIAGRRRTLVAALVLAHDLPAFAGGSMPSTLVNPEDAAAAPLVVGSNAAWVAAHATARARHADDVGALVRRHGGSFAAASAADGFDAIVERLLTGRTGAGRRGGAS